MTYHTTKPFAPTHLGPSAPVAPPSHGMTWQEMAALERKRVEKRDGRPLLDRTKNPEGYNQFTERAKRDRATILAFIRKRPATWREVSEATGLTGPAVQNHIRRLRSDDLVRTTFDYKKGHAAIYEAVSDD